MGKTIYDKENGFRRIGLSAEEQSELSQALRDLHIRQMRESIEDAFCVLPRTAPSNLVRVACALFEKRATASFTVYLEALDRKVHSIKNGSGESGQVG